MDYAAMLQHRRDSGADLTVACLTVDLEQARSFGVISVDANDQVVSFDETPDQPAGIPGGSGHRPRPGRLVDPDRRRAASAGTLIIGKGYQFA